MAWEGSDRNKRLPKDWHRLRRVALNAAGRRCQIRAAGCTDVATEVDHIRPGDDHSRSNLQAVCSECHIQKTAADNFARRAKKIAMRRRPPEGHPGQN